MDETGISVELMSAYTVVGVFVGELIKKFGMADWIIPINMVIGGVLALNLVEMSLPAFLLGASLGSGASGVYSVGKKVIKGKIAG